MSKLVSIEGLKHQADLIKDWVINGAGKLNAPTDSSNGQGKTLRSNGDGTTTWSEAGLPTNAQVEAAVAGWLDEHPEATTTVQDGSITKAKLINDLQVKVDEVDQLKSAIDNVEDDVEEAIDAVSELANDINNLVESVTESGGTVTITKKGGTTSAFVIPQGLAFDGGYIDPADNTLHLTLNDEDIEGYEPIAMPINGPTSAEYDSNYYLHFYSAEGDEMLGGPFLIEGGGGGSGSGGSAISLTNVVKPSTVRNGGDAIFSFTATSSDDTNINVVWKVNGANAATTTGASGAKHQFNAKGFLLDSSTNTVRAEITNEGGGSLTRSWTITSTAYNIEWGASIDPIMLHTTADSVFAVINVTAQARTENIVTVTVGENEKTQTVTGSRSITVELPASWFDVGANIVNASMTSVDETDKAEDIHFTVVWAYGAAGPIVAFSDSEITGTQYDTIPVRYMVYDPDSETANAEIQVGEEEPRAITAGREIQTYWYIPQTDDDVTITLTCGTETTAVDVTVEENPYNIAYVAGDNLRYNLDPNGHSNNDADRDTFAGLTLSSGFDWINGGFQRDSEGATAFVVKKGHRATMPRSIFADSDTNGKTIDISFKVANPDQYDAVAMQDLNNGNTIGVILRANGGEVRLNNATGQSFLYCEERRIDISVLVEDLVNQRVSTIWLDGIPSKVDKYEPGMLVQSENAMVIGSDHCDVWVYGIRCYNSKLSDMEMIQNYIYNGSTTSEKIERCIKNDVFDSNQRITPATLHAAMPDLTIIEIAADRMTVNKKDPVPADITITDGANVLELQRASSPTAGDGALFKVQGTSSAAYGRSALNMDLDFKKCAGKKYKISENSIPVNYINVKVNVASSENANNICAVDWYNEHQPFLIEARQDNTSVRDSVEGKPCAIFFTNTSQAGIWVSSQFVQPGETILYVMGDICNSKKNLEVFGEAGEGEHPTMGCVEVSGNDTEPQRFESTAAVYNPEDGEWQTSTIVDGKTVVTTEYEWRMEPSEEDIDDVVSAWNDMVAWVVSTIGNTAKFKAEFADYFTVDSMLYHFLMIEFFAAYDNVSKNTFYSYDWDESAGGYRWNIAKAYDWDTIIACDNDGKPFGDYGIDYGDTISGRSYFNAVTNTIWQNIKAAFQSELSDMYVTLRGNNTWNAEQIVAKWDAYQAKRPHAAMVKDAYIKYILPYKTNGVVIGTSTYSYDDSYLSRMNGSKTYQRRQFFTYQTDYMDGKYGYYSKTNSMQFRTNGNAGTKAFTVKAYAKTYITVIVDDNKAGSMKVAAGSTVTFPGISVGSNTTIYVTPDRLVQFVRPLNETQNSTFAASGAAKLMEAILGGANNNTAWSSGTGISVPSAILKELSIRNLVNFSASLNLTPNVELETLDTRGTNAGVITLPPYAPLTNIQLNSCSGLVARNLTKVNTFAMESGENLVTVWAEGCGNVINDTLPEYLLDAFESGSTATRSARIVGIDWTLENTDLLNYLLNAKAIDANGNIGEAPCVLTGQVYVPIIRAGEKALYDAAWPELTVSYGSYVSQHAVTFKNYDGSTLYTEYVDQGSDAVDPVNAGYISTPVKASTQEYHYTYRGWDTSLAQIDSSRTIIAMYNATKRSYTIKWFSKGILMDQQSVQYGEEAVYAGSDPTYTSEEPMLKYYLWTGAWDQSTGIVTGDMNVNAVFDEANLAEPPASTEDMNAAYLYGLRKRGASYVRQALQTKDRVLMKLGYDPEYANVESWETTSKLIFDGIDDYYDTGISLLADGIGPGWTLAVDFEFTEETEGATLLSLWQDDGYMGFKVSYTAEEAKNGPIISWGNSSFNSYLATNREMIVLRHIPGSQMLYCYISNTSNANIGLTTLPKLIDTITSKTLVLGCGQSDSQGRVNFAKGIIHKCKIWYADLGNTECQKIAKWPYETVCSELTGYGAYKLAGSENDYTNADFLSANTLHRTCAMNTTPTNQGGYAESYLTQWINTRVWNAVPLQWRSIIKQVNVPYLNRTAENAGEILTFDTNLFVPSWAEMQQMTDEPWIYEGVLAPWLTANIYRPRFTDFWPRANAQYFTQSTDPVLVESNHVEDGDVWKDTSRESRVYIRQNSDWSISAMSWLRTTSLETDTRFYIVNGVGTINESTATNYTVSVALRFSI